LEWYDVAMGSLEEDFAQGLISEAQFEQEVRYLRMELYESQRKVAQQYYDDDY